MLWPILQIWFFGVRSPCFTELMPWSHSSRRAETVLQCYCRKNRSQYLQYLQSNLEIFIRHLAAAVLARNRQYITGLSIHYWDKSHFWWLVPVKLRECCLQHSRTKLVYRYSFGPNGAPLGARWWSTLRSIQKDRKPALWFLREEMEFWPLGSESSPFCRTEWFHIHTKIALFHLSVWLIGQDGLEVLPTLVRFLAVCSSGRKVALGRL